MRHMKTTKQRQRVKPHSVEPVVRLDYYRTYGDPSDHKVRTHLEGIGDSYTLCGLDTSGDEMVHAKQPERIDRPRRITCEHCLQIMALVRAHDQSNK